MGLFKQRITFDQFIYFALTQIFDTYESKKEIFLDKAQWENKHKLNDKEREDLWELFTYLVPLSLTINAAENYFRGKYSNEDVSRRATKALVYYLYKDKGYNETQVDKFSDKYLKFVERIIDRFEKSTLNVDATLLMRLGVYFADDFCKDDRTYEEIKANKYTINSDKQFAAIKMAKPLLMQGGLLDQLFKQFNISF